MTDKKIDKKTETQTNVKNEPLKTETPAVEAKPATAMVVDNGAPKAPSKADDLLDKTVKLSLSDALDFARRNKLTFGLVLARRDPPELDAFCAEKLEGLRSLASDSSLPEDMQKAVRSIVDQASQVKPGMEEVTTRWRIPRIQIVQATSTQAARPDAAKNGDLYTTAGKMLEKPFPFIPLHFSHENIMFPVGAKIPACQAPDAKLGQPYGLCVQCPNLPFGMQNGGKGDQKKTDCQNQIVVIVASLAMTEIYMVQFSKTSRGAGSALQSLAGAQSFAWQQAFLLDTEKGQSELGNYHKYKVSATGKDNDAHKTRVAHAVCDLYTAERYRMLADHYRGVASAPAVAAAAEGQFQGGKLDAGLAGEVEPYDLGDNVAPAGSVRTSAKPM